MGRNYRMFLSGGQLSELRSQGRAGASVPGVCRWMPSRVMASILMWAMAIPRISPRRADILSPDASDVCVFLDEHPSFSVDDELYTPNMVCVRGATRLQACRRVGVSFADGHAEIHKWRDPWASMPLVDGGYMYNTMSGPNDMAWLKQRTTEP